MAHTKRSSKGTLFQINTVVAPTVYTTVPGCGDFNTSIGDRAEIDVTSHDSPGDFEETVLGMGTLSTFTIPMRWDGKNAEQKAIKDAHMAAGSVGAKITHVDGTIVTGTLLVKSLELQNPVKGVFDANVGFKWAAKPTYTDPV